jgi:hypothetical protein
MKLHISHGADPDNPDWFVVKPLEGEFRAGATGLEVTHEMEVTSLLHAGRTVYELDARPFCATLLPVTP